MLGITELKTGVCVDIEGDPYVVLSYQHSKSARGGAVMRTKLRNLRSGAVVDMNFKGGDKFDEAPMERRMCTYLYADGDGFVFMDGVSFDQFTLGSDLVGDDSRFLKEGLELKILFYQDQPVSLELPIKMDFEVTHTEPGVRGDTAQGGTKPATLETGAVITVPLFVKIGDVIQVNTVEGTYVQRVR
jgi:elongation factor P